MVIGVLRIVVDIPDSESLKDKRSVIRSLADRIRHKFEVAVAEVGELNQPRQGELGIACVSNDSRHADGVLARVASFAEANAGDGYVSRIDTEIMHLD